MAKTSSGKRKPLVSQFALSGIAIAIAGAMSNGARAQEVTSPAPPASGSQSNESIETIVVTGSRIRRTDTETTAPVTTISREQIESTGATSLSDLLKVITSNANGLGQSQTLGFAAGSSNINLRGLGSQYSLVLLNGRRLAPYGRPNVTSANIEPAVNIDSIPVNAIERVEILNNGGSAIYGSDAVAGVVNVITKKNFDGTTVDAHYGVSSRGDGAEKSVSLTQGSTGDGYSSLFFINYFINDGVRSKDRYISRSSDQRYEGGPNFNSGVGFPPTVFLEGVDGPVSLCDASQQNVAGVCTTNRNAYTPLEPPQNRLSLFGSVDRQFLKFDNFTFDGFVQALINKSSVKTSYYPTPISTAIDPDIFGGANNPNTHNFIDAYNTAHKTDIAYQDVDIRYAGLQFGPRLDEYQDFQDQYVTGFKGNLYSWTYELAGYYTSDDNTDYGTNYLNKAAMVQALTTGLDLDADGTPESYFNPYGGNNSQDVLNAIRARLATRGQSITKGFDMTFSGPLFELLGQNVSMAVGLERRFEDYSNAPDSQQQGGGILALSTGTPVSGSRALTGEYIEIDAPITKYLELDVAARHEEYSDFGGVTKPKFALKITPADWIVVRAGIDKGFRAPSLADLYSGQSTSFTSGYTDTARCALPGAPADYCDTTWLYQTTVGGNPTLKPEESKSIYAGFVIEPVRGGNMGVNFFDVKINNVITTLPLQTLIDANNPAVVQRGTPQPGFPNDPGPIINIFNGFLNGALLRTRGLDLDVSYDWMADILPKSWGRLKTSAYATYMYKYIYGDAANPQKNYMGTDDFGLALPRWKGYAQADYSYNSYGAMLRWNYVGKWLDSYGQGWEIGSVSTFDAQLSASPTFARGLKVTLGVDNVLDKMPPYASGSNNYSATFLGYDPALYSAMGRYFYLTASYAF